MNNVKTGLSINQVKQAIDKYNNSLVNRFGVLEDLGVSKLTHIRLEDFQNPMGLLDMILNGFTSYKIKYSDNTIFVLLLRDSIIYKYVNIK